MSNRQILTGSDDKCHVCGERIEGRYCAVITGDVLCGKCFDEVMALLEGDRQMGGYGYTRERIKGELIQLDPPEEPPMVCGPGCEDWQRCPESDRYGYCEHIHGFTEKGTECWY